MVQLTWQNQWEPSHTIWEWTEIWKWSGWLNRVIENHHIHTGDGHILGNGQVNFTTLVKTMTYRLRTDRDWKMAESTWQDDWELSHTLWRWSEIGKWSGELYKIIQNHHIPSEDGQRLSGPLDSMIESHYIQAVDGQRLVKGQVIQVHLIEWSFENYHIQAEDRQRLRNGQDNWTGSMNITYKLRVDGDWEMVRLTGQHHGEPSHTSWGQTEIRNGQVDLAGSLWMITYKLWMDREWEMVRSRQDHWEPSHTCWGWTEIRKWSGQFDRIIKNYYIQSEDGQRLRNGQVYLTGSFKTITYCLRIDRDWEMVRLTWQDHWESLHTSWGWTGIRKQSGQVDSIIENHHIHSEDGQIFENGQLNLTASLRTITYSLRMDRVKSTWQAHLKISHTCYGCTEIGTWSGQLDRIIENLNHYIHAGDGQILENGQVNLNHILAKETGISQQSCQIHRIIHPGDGKIFGNGQISLWSFTTITYSLRMDI